MKKLVPALAVSRRTKRIVGNLSVLAVLVAIVAVLVTSSLSSSFLQNDKQLTAEANAHTPTVQALPKVKAAIAPNESSQEWADRQFDMFLATAGANSLEAWPEGSPERNIVSVDSPSEGVFRITVADADYGDSALDGLASDFMTRVGCAAYDVSKVIVRAEGNAQGVSRSFCS